jgi:hypothetical protein
MPMTKNRPNLKSDQLHQGKQEKLNKPFQFWHKMMLRIARRENPGVI